MTTTQSGPVDYLSTAWPSATVGREGDDRDAHLLRLVLDLQLDALLLGLGAAAMQESRSPVAAPVPTAPGVSTSPGTAPWPRWAVEDIDLARALAAEAVSSGAALPATLGPDLTRQDERAVLDQLAARYESMRVLLGDLLARTAADLTSISRYQLLDLMAHCHKRLAELRSLADVPRGTTGQPRKTQQYLPGELLG